MHPGWEHLREARRARGGITVTTTDATSLLDWMARGRNGQVEAPTAIGRAAREEAARSNAADSKLSDISSLQNSARCSSAR